MKYKNKTDRNQHIESLMHDRINCMVFFACMIFHTKEAREAGTYFSSRFK